MALKNAKHEAFCQEYLKDLNQTKAYQRAYPDASYETALVNASKLLTNTNIQDRIKQLQEKTQKKAEITRDMLIDELKTLAFSDITTFVDENWSLKNNKDLTIEQRKALSAIEINEQTGEFGSKKTIKFKLHPKLDAIEKLAKHIGFYEDDNKQKAQLHITWNEEKTY